MYACQDCDYVATHLSRVKLHWEAKHDCQIINCNFCGKQYPSTNALRSHVSRQHRQQH